MVRFSKLSTRIFLGFTAVILIMIGMTIVSMSQVDQISDDLYVVDQVNGTAQRYAINFRGSVHDRAIALRDVVLVQD